MPHERSRRTVLQAISVLPAIGLAGCFQSDSSELRTTTLGREGQTSPPPTPGFETPAPGDCTPARSYPTPPVHDRARSYPPYPEDLTVETAASFAEKYEKTYQVNRFLANDPDAGVQYIQIPGGVPDWAVMEHARGYLVGVNGELKTGERLDNGPDATAITLHGDAPFAAWYYLVDRFALRNGLRTLQETTDPDMSGADVVVCD